MIYLEMTCFHSHKVDYSLWSACECLSHKHVIILKFDGDWLLRYVLWHPPAAPVCLPVQGAVSCGWLEGIRPNSRVQTSGNCTPAVTLCSHNTHGVWQHAVGMNMMTFCYDHVLAECITDCYRVALYMHLIKPTVMYRIISHHFHFAIFLLWLLSYYHWNSTLPANLSHS